MIEWRLNQGLTKCDTKPAGEYTIAARARSEETIMPAARIIIALLNGSSRFSSKFVKHLGRLSFMVVLVASVLSLNGYAGSFTAHIEADLDLDGKRERIDLSGERDAALQIWRGRKLLWQGVPARWKPWKLEIADVDGDGKREIVVGVFKSTKFFPKPHNCLFIYGWTGKLAFPKWLGSSLGRPFTDFVFADMDNNAGNELIALETTLKGKKSMAVYRWNSFGFTLDWEQGEWQSAKILSAKNGGISLEADGKRIFLARDKTRSEL